ncbi:hypothetical protein KPSA1_03856 [Pseudomonas syringae pv. actinidiae]|uniref:Uncharacterized protein n=1 Tax=Pseudomonas syringae pv. actinidiae TaxID=103796 RepID=A0A2V0R859_PSESF|nr:hypothetical protein KPSA1_03856 [Pseudomonas syringae pv. actinidiae]GBH17170.1 hypothetical protein KPSA3_03132 [Pseudomonas syringae pv. actinidiae]
MSDIDFNNPVDVKKQLQKSSRSYTIRLIVIKQQHFRF